MRGEASSSSDARKKNQKQTFCLHKNTAQLVQVCDTHSPRYPYCLFLFFHTHDCRLTNGPLNIFLFNKYWSKQYHTIKCIFTYVITQRRSSPEWMRNEVMNLWVELEIGDKQMAWIFFGVWEGFEESSRWHTHPHPLEPSGHHRKKMREGTLSNEASQVWKPPDLSTKIPIIK